jgi:hypothetical protein
MDGEKRRSYRRLLKYPAKIDLGDGTPPRLCVLVDISATGARVTVEKPDQIPNRFSLLLAAEGATRRRCKVVWREANQLGLEFMKLAAVKPGPQRGAFKDLLRR